MGFHSLWTSLHRKLPAGCLSLRIENRPSVLGIFIYVPWGGVGWGNNVHVLAHSHDDFDVTPRHVHLHVRTYVMLRWRCVTSRRGGVGWGGVITFTYLRTPMMLRDLIAFRECILDRKEQWFAQMAQSATLDWHRPTSWYILPAHIAKTNLSRRSADMLENPSGFILAHSTWRMIKASVPDQLTSCPENEQKLNDLIWTYVRTWQWRWEANVVGKALLEETGAYLAKM